MQSNRNMICQLSVLCWQVDIPVFWWSTPGLGKTQTAIAISKQLKKHLEILVGSSRLPEDVAGYPIKVKDQIKRVPDTWVYRIKNKVKEGVSSLLFLDDFTTCNEAVESAFYRVVQEKVAGDEPLENTAINAAGNPPGSAAGARPLSAAMANRFAHFKFKFNASDWAERSRASFPLPELYFLPKDWQRKIPVWSAVIEEFCRSAANAELNKLHENFGGDGGEILGYPSERSLSNLSLGLAAIDASITKADETERIEYIRMMTTALIGIKAQNIFMEWFIHQDLPNPEKMIQDTIEGKKVDLPTRHDQAFMTISAVVQAVTKTENTVERFKAALKILNQASPNIAGSVFGTLWSECPPSLSLDDEMKTLIARYKILA